MRPPCCGVLQGIVSWMIPKSQREVGQSSSTSRDAAEFSAMFFVPNPQQKNVIGSNGVTFTLFQLVHSTPGASCQPHNSPVAC